MSTCWTDTILLLFLLLLLSVWWIWSNKSFLLSSKFSNNSISFKCYLWCVFSFKSHFLWCNKNRQNPERIFQTYVTTIGKYNNSELSIETHYTKEEQLTITMTYCKRRSMPLNVHVFVYAYAIINERNMIRFTKKLFFAEL